ncbi:MAG: ABC transporter permease subunit [Pseudomonadota bacterium]
MIFFGLGPSSAISLVFLGAFYPIPAQHRVRRAPCRPEACFEAASMLGCSGSAMFRRVVLPAALPSIFNGLRLGLGFAWVVIVVGEMTGVPTGLGAAILDGRTLSRTDLIISGMIVIGIAGFVSDKLVLALNNRLLRWNVQHG